MSNRQDRQGARTPADLERRYSFERRFGEIEGIALDARTNATEAKQIATSINETNDGISLKVKALEEQVDGALALEILEAEDGTKYSQLRSDVDKVKFESNDISIKSDNFTLTEEGEITASKGEIGGWKVDEYGIHQAEGVYGTYTIQYSRTGADLVTETYEGYLFYRFEKYGIFRYIYAKNEFGTEAYLWRGDMLGNYTITVSSGGTGGDGIET